MLKIRKMHLLIFGLFNIIFANSFAKDLTAGKNQLNKIYHHRMSDGLKEEKNSTIELGSLVCYFSAAPVLNSLSKNQKTKQQEELIFFFPKTLVSSSEARAAIKSLNASKQSLYTIRFEEVTSPTQGIKLYLSFDSEKVSLKYDVFDSIGLQKGVVFRFYNQLVLKELNSKCCKPVLNMACAKKPSHIAVDCGHGGADTGTIGVFNYAEKQVTLGVGLELARLLKDDGFKVTLTRSTDTDVALDERTSMANKKKADLLVSIHANNAPSKTAQGVETFCMDPVLLSCVDCSMEPACKTLACEQERQRCTASNILAKNVHTNVLACANSQYAIADRSVRKSVSQMLLGAAMPSVLIEVGFLSNSYEAQLLGQEAYQKLLAQGIRDGIKSYAHQIVS